MRFLLIAAFFYFIYKFVFRALFKGLGAMPGGNERDIHVNSRDSAEGRLDKEGDYIDFEEVKE